MNTITPSVINIEKAISNREIEKIRNLQSKDFNFFSASFGNLLPYISVDRHYSLFVEMMVYRSLAVFHSEQPQLGDKINLKGNLEFLERPEQVNIFACYHLGSYRAIMSFLILRSISFALLLDRRTYEQQSSVIRRALADIGTAFGKVPEVELINVEDHTSLIKSVNLLKSGKSLVAYVDGNTGHGGIFNKNEQLFENIPFLDGTIHSRKGIAWLSFLANVPIIPTISYFKNKDESPVLEFHNPIQPAQSKADRDHFVRETTIRLYRVLEDKLLLYPTQWEAWLYVHKFIDPSTLNAQVGYRRGVPGGRKGFEFNTRDFATFMVGDEHYLLSKRTYESYKISNELFNLVETIKLAPVEKVSGRLGASLRYLTRKNILKPRLTGRTLGANPLVEALRENIIAEKSAIIENDRTISYSELWHRVDQVACEFRNAGVVDGCIVGIMMENSIELAIIFLALASINASPYILNVNDVEDKLAQSINFYCLVGIDSSVLGRIKHHSFRESEYIKRHGIRIHFNSKFNARKKIKPAVLVSSSGSTNIAKSILLSYEGVLMNMRSNVRSLEITGVDRTLVLLPMSYSYGLIGQFLSHLLMGCTIVLNRNKIYLLQISDFIERYSITTLFTVPVMLRQFLFLRHSSEQRSRLSSLRIVTIGGNHVDGYTARKATEIFPCQVVKTYGLAEAGPRACTNFITRSEQGDMHSVGKAIDQVAIRILDEASKPVKDGVVGRILVESPSVAVGYLNMRARHIKPNCKVLTKDFGYITSNGNLVVLGRELDYVSVNGKRLWFSELEELVYATGHVIKVSIDRFRRRLHFRVLLRSRGEWNENQFRQQLAASFGNELEKMVQLEYISPMQLRNFK